MNQIAIGININGQQMLVGAMWPTKRTVKAMARCKLARLKRTVQQAVLNVAMAIRTLKARARLKLARLKRTVENVIINVAMAVIPMPQAAVA